MILNHSIIMSKFTVGVSINKRIFILKFIIYTVVIYLILEPLEDHLVYTVAYHSYLLLRVFTEAFYYGNHIYLNGLNIEIARACTGVIYISIYLALILSLSKDIREVLVGLPLLLVIYCGNLLRILLTGIFGIIFIEGVYLVHEVVGYLITPIFSVIAVIIYLKILSKMRSK